MEECLQEQSNTGMQMKMCFFPCIMNRILLCAVSSSISVLLEWQILSILPSITHCRVSCHSLPSNHHECIRKSAGFLSHMTGLWTQTLPTFRKRLCCLFHASAEWSQLFVRNAIINWCNRPSARKPTDRGQSATYIHGSTTDPCCTYISPHQARRRGYRSRSPLYVGTYLWRN